MDSYQIYLLLLRAFTFLFFHLFCLFISFYSSFFILFLPRYFLSISTSIHSFYLFQALLSSLPLMISFNLYFHPPLLILYSLCTLIPPAVSYKSMKISNFFTKTKKISTQKKNTCQVRSI